MDNATRSNEIIQAIADYIEHGDPHDGDVFEEVVSVDGVIAEDSPVSLSSNYYTDIYSVRIGYGGQELYDIFVAKVR